MEAVNKQPKNIKTKITFQHTVIYKLSQRYFMKNSKNDFVQFISLSSRPHVGFLINSDQGIWHFRYFPTQQISDPRGHWRTLQIMVYEDWVSLRWHGAQGDASQANCRASGPGRVRSPADNTWCTTSVRRPTFSQTRF